jgi:hypothetical protein
MDEAFSEIRVAKDDALKKSSARDVRSDILLPDLDPTFLSVRQISDIDQMTGLKRKANHSEVIELLDSDDEDSDIAPLAIKRVAPAERQNKSSQLCSSQDPALSQGGPVFKSVTQMHTVQTPCGQHWMLGRPVELGPKAALHVAAHQRSAEAAAGNGIAESRTGRLGHIRPHGIQR